MPGFSTAHLSQSAVLAWLTTQFFLADCEARRRGVPRVAVIKSWLKKPDT